MVFVVLQAVNGPTTRQPDYNQSKTGKNKAACVLQYFTPSIRLNLLGGVPKLLKN